MIAAALAAVACSSAACSSPAAGPGVSDEFARAEIVVSGQRWTVAVADEPGLRARGLQGVTDLGPGLDGMLFVFDTATTSSFTMRGTEMPIDISFFDGEGRLVDTLEMVPCTAEPCPSYRSSGPFRYALETEEGGFNDLGVVSLDIAALPDAAR
jgi:uncharacterized membrane protein (UPF0127 family)